MTSHTALIKELFVAPVLRERGRLVRVVLAVGIGSTANAAILFLVGPFLKALFTVSDSGGMITVGSLVPTQAASFFPGLAGAALSISTIIVGLPIAMTLAGLTKAGAAYFLGVDQQALAIRVATHYRRRLFDAIIRRSYVEASAQPPAHWMSMVMNDVYFVQARFSEYLGLILRDFVMVGAAYLVLLLIYWPAAIVLTVLAPIIALSMGRAGRSVASYSAGFQRQLGEMAGLVLDIRRRFAFIRSQHGEATESRKFFARNKAYLNLALKSLRVRSLHAPGMEWVGLCVFAGVIYALSSDLLPPDLTGDSLIIFLAAIGVAVKPLKNIGEQVSKIGESRGAIASGLELIAQSDGPLSKDEHGEAGPSCDGSVDFRVEAFRVAIGEGFALDVEGFHVSPGKAIAIIGPSGAGKSSVIKALAGLIPFAKWQADRPKEEVAGRANLVSQSPFLFRDSIRANLTYGLKAGLDDASPAGESAIWRALECVSLDEFVRGLPEGLDSDVFGFAGNLSGGQIQRFSIARALLRAKPLLLLDEATSAIDGEMDREITERLIEEARARGGAVIMVTHRYEQLERFDEILLMEAGRIVARGDFATIQKDGRYRELRQ